MTGAASDKVAALTQAGAIVTDSPAKIGAEMLKVSGPLTAIFDLDLIRVTGHESCRIGVDF